jgi:predicted transcriptional regulator of viral defense system
MSSCSKKGGIKLNLAIESVLISISSLEQVKELDSQLNHDQSVIFVSFDKRIINFLKNVEYQQVYQVEPSDIFIDLPTNIQKVLIFEDTIQTTCTMIQLIKRSTIAPIIVISKEWYKLRLYYSIGAKHVIFSKSNNFRFLLTVD